MGQKGWSHSGRSSLNPCEIHWTLDFNRGSRILSYFPATTIVVPQQAQESLGTLEIQLSFYCSLQKHLGCLKVLMGPLTTWKVAFRLLNCFSAFEICFFLGTGGS